MKLVQKYPILGSSIEPGKVALRVRGILFAIGPAIILIAQMKGWEIGEEGLKLVIDKIVEVVSAGAVIVGAGMHLWGWIRKYI